MGEEAFEQIWQGLEQTVEGWARSLEVGGFEPEGHAYRVAELALQLAQKCGVPTEPQFHLIRGALLHDIGKIVLPEAVRNKAGKLDPTERALMEQHPLVARQMLLPIEILRPAIEIPLCHHERWDGKGYPRGLEGEAIPLSARIFAVVDVWDSLTHDQPFRPAWDRETALEHLAASAGTHFDPHVVQHFLVLAQDPAQLQPGILSERPKIEIPTG